MGITIHFEGRLRNESAFDRLVSDASVFAQKHGWKTEPLAIDQVHLERVRDEIPVDYDGPVRGIILYPSLDCDPLRFEFDLSLYIQEFCKTQFAGAETHVEIVELFKILKIHFAGMKIEDEGEYWETGDIAILRGHFSRIQSVIDAELQKNPSARAKVRTPEGRFVDIMS